MLPSHRQFGSISGKTAKKKKRIETRTGDLMFSGRDPIRGGNPGRVQVLACTIARYYLWATRKKRESWPKLPSVHSGRNLAFA
jgi:hypothetical protein